jgi:hypothetical protein
MCSNNVNFWWCSIDTEMQAVSQFLSWRIRMRDIIMGCNKYKGFASKFEKIKKNSNTNKKEALLNLAIEMQKNGFMINPYDVRNSYNSYGVAESNLMWIIGSALSDFETKRQSRMILWITIVTLLAAVVSATCSIIFIFMN